MFITHFVHENVIRFAHVELLCIIHAKHHYSAKLIIHAEHGSSAQLTLLTKWFIQCTFTFVTSVLEILNEAQTQWVNKRTKR